MTANQVDLDQQPRFMGHPVGLYVCALTEMWERFSFYGMKFLLMLYVTKYHLFSDDAGYDVLGNYAAMVYALPLIGGMLADKYLGMRKAVIFGGVMLCLGHLGMAFEGTQAYVNDAGETIRDDTAIQVFYFSLALIILGVGFLKPNISTIVGRLYTEKDPARDSGFTIFYMGINIGSAIATLTCGYLGETYGWKYGFGLAGIGMVVGLIIFQFGQKYLYGHAEPANPALLKEPVLPGINKERMIYIVSILSLVLLWGIVQNHDVVVWALKLSGIGFVIWLIYYMITECTRVQAQQMGVLTVLIVASIVFWALFEQAGASMTVFADRVMERPGTVKASQFGSLNAIFIIMFAPFFAWLWIWLAKKNWEPSTPAKFGWGILQAGLGFGALVVGIAVTPEGSLVFWGWMALAYLLHSTGELCLSPVGLSAVTKLSVDKVVGLMMGAWFLATAASEKVATILSKIASVETVNGEVADIGEAIASYNDLFTTLLYLGVGFGVLMFILTPLLKKGMHGVH